MGKRITHSGDVDDDLVVKVYSGGWERMTLCSEGGDLYAARAISDYLLIHPKPVLVTGKCFSAAIAVAVSASCCRATPGTRFMAHRPSITGLSGQAAEIAKEKDELTVWYKWFLQLLADRTDTPLEEWKDLADDETYFGIQAALKLGVVDEVEQ